MSQSIQPLRIQKNTSNSSPSKPNGVSISRPLSELGPMERRRNSPSYNQQSRKSLFNGDSSPFDSSPCATNSPRLYWQNRDPASPTRLNTENRNPLNGRDTLPSATKRSSIENLKRASRVKNSNMFAREHKQDYDPTSTPTIERPLAGGRPLSSQVGSLAGVKARDSLLKDELEKVKVPTPSPVWNLPKLDYISEPDKSPSKSQPSPSKSSLTKNSRYARAFDLDHGMCSEEEDSFTERQLPPGKSLHRHAKSVTFDAAPPQVNEYETTTPVPSSIASGSRYGSYDSTDQEFEEEDESFDRGSSIDRDDSFDASLEDTDKTPVVLPEDWRFMSPSLPNDELAKEMEDPFDDEKSSPAPTAKPMLLEIRTSPTRTDSVNSNGERRPLPPLPDLSAPMFPRARSDSNSSLLAVAERIATSQRTLPSPPIPASLSKSELQGLSGSTVTIEERLRLMMLQESELPKSSTEDSRERRFRRGHSSEESPRQNGSNGPAIKIHEDEDEKDNTVADLEDYPKPPRISRESILRKIKNQHEELVESDYDVSPTSMSSQGKQQALDVDPDIPIPSLEDGFPDAGYEDDVLIKQEEEDSEVDVYAIPEMYKISDEINTVLNANVHHHDFSEPNISLPGDHSASQNDDDDESFYSTDLSDQPLAGQVPRTSCGTDDEGPATPRPTSPLHSMDTNEAKETHRMSLPQFASLLGEDDFGLSFQSYMTPSPPMFEEPVKSESIPTANPSHTTEPLYRPSTPEDQIFPPPIPGFFREDEDEPKTPDSVIRHSRNSPTVPESPGVPELDASIKAHGSKLKTRPSLTPADVQEMAETRRRVSAQRSLSPPVSKADTKQTGEEEDECAQSDKNSVVSFEEDKPTKDTKRKSSLVQLEVPVEEIDEGLSIGLKNEFDRVIEAQKVASNFSSSFQNPIMDSPRRAGYITGTGFKYFVFDSANASTQLQKGYLMRHNTKLVVASSASTESAADTFDSTDLNTRGTRSAGNSPRKPSQTKPWTAEPWNGKMRRKSIRQSVGSSQSNSIIGAAPPLPGQPSNVSTALDSVAEHETAANFDETDDDTERGRLFVKVVGVKELDMPLPKNERSYFALTLDNGLHCVTTAWLELGKYAPIGQEFELIVLNDLEFQLTLQTKIEEPKPKRIIESPIKAPKTPKASHFSRVFQSPRKRKELEMKEKEEAQRVAQQNLLNAQANKRATEPNAWDLLHNLVAKDGSFARSYISLKDHESQAYGKPYIVDIPCFNEWASAEVRTVGSARSGRGTISMQRKAPYQIGKLELQLFYVPKPKTVRDDDMPKSMNAAIRQLQEAENQTEVSWEGNLSQQGGDCPYWRRRFFRLEGSKLTAYHEATRQPRATINLAKASKLIDDKSALTQKEVSGKGGSRRKSAFAAEEEGYMFVEEGFRVRFANGETIDFYADSASEKNGWMKVLAGVVGKEPKLGKTWTDVVLTKQRATAQRAARTHQGQIKPPSSAPRSVAPAPGSRQASQVKSHGSSPQKRPISGGAVPPVVERDARHTAEQRRLKTKSLIF